VDVEGLTGKRVATMGGFPPLEGIFEHESGRISALLWTCLARGHGITLGRIASRKLESLRIARSR
jgi:hypothetical protein